MKKLATKVHVGTAACALAAAAVLTPLPAAQASPLVPAPLASAPGSVGGSAGGGAELISPLAPTRHPTPTPGCGPPVAPGVSPFRVPGGNTIRRNSCLWVGPP